MLKVYIFLIIKDSEGDKNRKINIYIDISRIYKQII